MTSAVPPYPDVPLGPGGARSTPWYLDFGGVFRRHPVLMTLAILLSAAAGFFGGQKFKTNLYTIEARERFVKTPLPDGGKVAYDSMSLQAYADLFLSDDLLKPVAEEFADRLPKENPIRFLQKEVKVDTPRISDIIELKFDAAEPEFGIALLDRLMERHIDYTNQLRRKSILRTASENLKHKIADCDSNIRRFQRTIDDYRARVGPDTAIEKLETADLDSATVQRRKSLIDDIDRVKARMKEIEATLKIKKIELAEAESLLQKRAIPSADVTKIEREVAVLQSQLQTNQEYIANTERKYREVPLEFFDSKITDLKSQRTTAELDLKLLASKLDAARKQNISPMEIDSHDEDWVKLRTKLLGPDNPEFEVIKQPTAPAFPTVSNRKMLTLGGALAPLGVIYLLLAFTDMLRGAGRAKGNIVDARGIRLPNLDKPAQNGHTGSGRLPKPLPPNSE